MEENTYSQKQIQKLVHQVRDVERQVTNEYEQIQIEGNNSNQNERSIVVVIGPTGSGKTTLYYALTGKQMKGFRDGIRKRLKPIQSEENFKIGHGGLSETSIPGLKYDQGTNIIYCDCPGFFDNRNDIQDITNSFAISHVLSQASNAKILLLTSYSDVFATRGKPIYDSCKIIEKLIPKEEDLRPSIGLIITAISPDDYAENATYLDDVDCRDSWLLKHFKSNETGNYKNVFHFPAPKNADFNDPLKDFKDKDKILTFIRQNNNIKLEPFVSLSNEAKLMILKGIDSFGDLSKLLRLFVDRIRIDIAESDDNLIMWKERVQLLNQCQFSTPEDFVNKCREIINPSSNLYDDMYNQFMKINDWRKFLEKVIVDDVKYQDEIINRESNLLSPVFLDITKYFDESLSNITSILNSRIDKSNIAKKRDELLEELKKQHEENIRLEKEKSDEQLKYMQKEEEFKRQLAALNEQNLSYQREIENIKAHVAMMQNQGDGGFFGSLVSGAIGGYLISLL